MGKIVNLPPIKLRSASAHPGLRKLSPDLISKARDETATQVNRIGLTFSRHKRVLSSVLTQSGQPPPERQRNDKRATGWASVVLRVYVAWTCRSDPAQGLSANLCRAQRPVGSTCTVGAANASANLGAAPKPTDTVLQCPDLLFAAACDDAALCMEGRRVSRLGNGSLRRCRSGHRGPCHAATQQIYLALKGAAKRGSSSPRLGANI